MAERTPSSTSFGEGIGWGATVALSLALHLGLALWIWHLPGAPDVRAQLAWVELPTSTSAIETPGTSRVARPSEPLAGGSRASHNVDTHDSGRGGDAGGEVAFVLLVAGAHDVTLRDSIANTSRVTQIQRIRTSPDRLSWENRRATPNPDDDAFLASGQGIHPERRPVRRRDAREGAAHAPSASRRGGEREGAELAPGTLANERGGRAGQRADSPGRGILGGRGAHEQRGANVAHGRPSIDEGPAATLAQYAGRVQDDTDSEQLASTLLQRSIVDASRRGGRGAGEGGVEGAGALGNGRADREGGRARPHGPGDGRYAALDTDDDRYQRWYLQQRRKVEDALHYPRERALARDQGRAVYRLEVRRDGSLAGPPHTVRGTGFGDLDEAARVAIRDAVPFSPLPDDLAPGQPTIRFDLTIEFSNPMVR